MAQQTHLEAGKADALAALETAAGLSSWESMVESHPEIATAIEGAIAAGATSDDVYRTLRKDHGVEFCKWCRTVARYLENV